MADIFYIDMLPGREGDCLWIAYGDPDKPNRLLVDGGRQIAYDTVKAGFVALPADQKTFELGILTHVDADHVEGILELMEDTDRGVTFDDFWFNAFHHLDPENFVVLTENDGIEDFGAVQGERLTEALVKQKWPWNKAFGNHPVVVPQDGPLPQKRLPGGMILTLLSPSWSDLKSFKNTWKREVEKAGMVPGIHMPDEEPPEDDIESFGAITVYEVEQLAALPFKKDTSKANGSSIAVLAEFDDKKLLLAGDVHANTLAASIARCPGFKDGKLKIDAFKVSHHGSRKTLSDEVLERLDCPRFLISTNGSRHKHPDREAIARILILGGEKKHLFFNYDTKFTKAWNLLPLKDRFKYQTNYPDPGEDGKMRVDLMKTCELSNDP